MTLASTPNAARFSTSPVVATKVPLPEATVSGVAVISAIRRGALPVTVVLFPWGYAMILKSGVLDNEADRRIVITGAG